MNHGGRRVGAGRPAKAKTKVIRVPEASIASIQQFLAKQHIGIPLFGSSVRAGFPSPADDYIEDYLDLNQYLIKHPAATFLVKAKGDSMIQANIQSGDILVVDKSIEPSHGHIVIAAINGELTVKQLYQKNNLIKLVAANPAYPDIIITQEMDSIIWGIVRSVIHEF